MPITLTPEQTAAIRKAEDALTAAVAAVTAEPDVLAKRQMLNTAWFRLNDLYGLAKDAEAEARAQALKHIEGEAA